MALQVFHTNCVNVQCPQALEEECATERASVYLVSPRLGVLMHSNGLQRPRQSFVAHISQRHSSNLRNFCVRKLI